MTEHAPPKRATHQQSGKDVIKEFNVPREQVKPCFKSHETQFDGIQSPINASINFPTNNINEIGITDHHKTQTQQILFKMYNQQTTMCCAPAQDDC